MTNADWWARVVQARTELADLIPRRVWTLRNGSREAEVGCERCPASVRRSCRGWMANYGACGSIWRRAGGTVRCDLGHAGEARGTRVSVNLTPKPVENCRQAGRLWTLVGGKEATKVEREDRMRAPLGLLPPSRRAERRLRLEAVSIGWSEVPAFAATRRAASGPRSVPPAIADAVIHRGVRFDMR